MSRSVPWFGWILILSACGGSPERASERPAPETALPDVARISGTITMGLGDATSTYTATFQDGALVAVAETLSLGDYGEHHSLYSLEAHALVAYSQSGWRAVFGDRIGERDTVELTASWDDSGALLETDFRINGSAVPAGPAELEGPRRHLETLRVDIAQRSSRQALRSGPSPAGRYTAALPAASGPGRRLALDLYLTQEARLEHDYQNEEPVLVERGVWWVADEGTFVLSTTKDHRFVRPDLLLFEHDGTQLRLAGGGNLGSEGVRFQWESPAVPAPLLGVTWEWEAFFNPVESFSVESPAAYTLAFNAEGKVGLRVDCNRGATRALLGEGGAFDLEPLERALADCGPDSRAAGFAGLLEDAVTWFVRDGKLFLELPVDSGTLRFRAAAR